MKIKVIGIGGCGCNTAYRLSGKSLRGAELFAINTDAQSLKSCNVQNRLLIGKKSTGGLGAGMDWKLGKRAAEESAEDLKKILKGAEIAFLTCGLGGGSGTAGISVLGRIAREMGILTIAVVTLPFSFEGELRKRVARQGLENLKKNIDAYLTIPNDRVLKLMGKSVSLSQAFLKIDEVLIEAIDGISGLLSSNGIISVDFADLEEVLKNSGRAILGIGQAKGEQRATSAVSRALQSPMLDFTPKSAKGILFNVGGRDVSLSEVNLVANFVKKIAEKNSKIIFGVSEDKDLDQGEIKVTLIATGVE